MAANYSLSSRLQWIVALVLTTSLGITGLVLDNTFKANSEGEARSQLDLFFHSLLAEADCCEAGFKLPAVHKLPGLNQRNSGLYAKVIDADGKTVWLSPSADSVLYELNSIAINIPQRGDKFIGRKNTGFEEPVYIAAYTVAFDNGADADDYTFIIVHSLLPLSQKLAAYRLTLWGWLVSFALFFMVVQALILRWAMAPLRAVVRDLYAVQDGKMEHLDNQYPNEISRLTQSLNQLLDHEKKQRERHRNSLADLAHSMKTPLAVLRSFAESDASRRDPGEIIHEITRLDEMISYQLQKAVISGRRMVAAPVHLADIVEKIIRTLDKVYADKGVKCTVNIDPDEHFYGEKADIYEILGNLIENAYKYTKDSVKVYSITDRSQRAKRLCAFVIEDNGPGIPETRRQQILTRGIRLDTHEPGQGLGLAMVADVIDGYSGSIDIEANHAGGARFIVIV